MLLEDLYFVITTILAIAGAIGTFIYFIWNSSKKTTTIELNIAQTKIDYLKDMDRIQQQHLADVQALKDEIQRQIVERRDDISERSLQSKDELNNLQKQIENLKSDVKGLLSKIEVAYSNIAASEKIHDEIKKEILEKHKFHSDWNQRIEDTNKETVRMIENVRKQLMDIVIGFHGPVVSKSE